jgi:hypothetical protein
MQNVKIALAVYKFIKRLFSLTVYTFITLLKTNCMKPFLTLLAIIALLAQGYSQTVLSLYHKSARMQGANRQFVMSLLQRQDHAAAKTTLTKERLISSDYHENSFRPNLNIYDSSRYVYSGDNGSQFDLNQLQYNFPATQFDYDEPILNTLTFGVKHPDIMCDSAIGLNRDPSVLTLSNTTIAAYDAAGNLVNYKSISQDTGYTASIAYYNTYNVSGQPTLSYSFSTPDIGSTWDTMTRRYFTYNGASQLTADSTYTRNGSTWYLSKRFDYTYDGSGNLTQVDIHSRDGSAAPLLYTAKDIQTYYTGGNLKSVYIYSDTGTGMYLAYTDSFGYAAGTNFFNFAVEYGYTATGWMSVYNCTKHLNANNLPDTQYNNELIFFYDTSGALIGSQNIYFKYFVTYNTHNDPVTMSNYINDGSGFSFNSTQRYFYEPATAIANPTKIEDFNIYPNPSADLVYVTPADLPSGTVVQLLLTDLQGKLLRSLTAAWQGTALQLPVSGLPPGVYIINMNDSKGNNYTTQKIVKQ